MAVTGFILFGFCVEHLVGMLLFFKGAGVINGYASLLRFSPVALWTARTVILAAAIIHIWTATVLVLRQMRARPTGYQKKRWRTVSCAARTMKYSGPMVFLFVLFHVAHFSWGVPITPARYVEGDVYANIANSFRSDWVVVVYVVGMALLGLHLAHGGYSMFESIGVRHPRIDVPIRVVVGVATFAVVVGFVAIPVAVYFRLVGG